MAGEGPAGRSRLPAVVADGGAGGLARALTLASGEFRACTVAVAGDPGGVVHLSRGAVTAVTSPGTPDAASMLLTSGRVGEGDWASCRRDAAAGDGLGPVLLSRSLVGPHELQVVCMMSAADAAFAMAAGRVDGSTQTVDDRPPELSAPQGIDRDWLLGETGRRLAALASLRNPLSPIADRVRSTAAAPTVELSGVRTDLLRYADGRHTARDIAVLLGRGLFAVTTELSRMVGEGLIEVVAPGPGGSALVDRPPPDQLPGRLPLRQRGASRINDVLPLRPVSARRTGPADWAQ